MNPEDNALTVTSALDPEMVGRVPRCNEGLSQGRVGDDCSPHEMGFTKEVAEIRSYSWIGSVIVEQGTPKRFS